MGIRLLSVLVADDDSSVRELLGRFLADRHHAVELATDGDEVLKASGARDFDVIVLDPVMPNRVGMETIRKLRKRGSKPQIVAISAESNVYLLRSAKALGASATLEKPFDRAEFLQAVEEGPP